MMKLLMKGWKSGTPTAAVSSPMYTKGPACYLAARMHTPGSLARLAESGAPGRV